ncbi:FKBP-type peptidyl-prolyl cis-trans isomerase [Sphingobacterium sp. DN00404]|uniref:Peptidyl-prolyl cis-trans isomerase n=1 Tax=Sphingobacterium micropteri TaxID=2763501 RepID=A0ABR7YMA1_9SPHI|nr:FKBP-type peptidyl-prolyl cis-trans isomerase [Sphingobacterium micropteri]MBD1432461.1 FKBP-type peptidyl-prolyl cis-trans isomerase [Sphingobacterium micropteri]
MNINKIGLAVMAVTCTGMSAAQAQVLKSNTDSVSYALGKDVGSSLTSSGVKINAESFLQGVNDAIQGKEELIGEEEGIRIIKAAFAKAAEEKINVFKEEEIAFFNTLKEKPSVQHLQEGLYYEVIQEGSGQKPTGDDEVTVHYKGTLANGKVFDNSYERGEPLDIDLANVIKGWQLGIPLMASGAKYKLYIPSSLGYGERGAGRDIPPYSPLIFEIELIAIKGQEAPATL